MTATCNFGTFLQEAIRDRLVLSLRREWRQRKDTTKCAATKQPTAPAPPTTTTSTGNESLLHKVLLRFIATPVEVPGNATLRNAPEFFWKPSSKPAVLSLVAPPYIV
ncbi:hypothetical protein HPB50_005047 [Hyalomma asiaticum]|uniref:Uncharacterized protein n=1 Tax=Hyalomma asiaticum TaxID=266040 RepID=A0ACB7RRX8_HYAAI|nr:hypothetical protein HPB50_005047 [Hyalomma asiaticum]